MWGRGGGNPQIWEHTRLSRDEPLMFTEHVASPAVPLFPDHQEIQFYGLPLPLPNGSLQNLVGRDSKQQQK